MKILVIEDEPELNQLSVESLRSMGHDVWSAQSLAEARTVFDGLDHKIDLIIADQRLPDGNGADFALEVREKYPRVRMAMVSGYLSAQDREALEAASIRCYSKPALYRKVAEDARVPPPVNKPVLATGTPSAAATPPRPAPPPPNAPVVTRPALSLARPPAEPAPPPPPAANLPPPAAEDDNPKKGSFLRGLFSR